MKTSAEPANPPVVIRYVSPDTLVSHGGTTVRRLLAFTLVAVAAVGAASLYAADDDTPQAAATRKKLQMKVSFTFKEQSLVDVLDEVKEATGVTFIIDTRGGVSRNQKINLNVKDVTLADALDKMFEKNGLGYIVVSGAKDAYNGSILIKQGKERGSPIKDDSKDKDKKDK
jgi:type II secretory pathway component GspD/PulD (secretin)